MSVGNQPSEVEKRSEHAFKRLENTAMLDFITLYGLGMDQKLMRNNAHMNDLSQRLERLNIRIAKANKEIAHIGKRLVELKGDL